MLYRLFFSMAAIGLMILAWGNHYQAAGEPPPKSISAEVSVAYVEQIQPLLVKTCGK